MRQTLFPCVIGAVVAVACAACAPAKPPSQPPPDECSAPWPTGESTPEDTGRISIRFKNELTRAFGVRRVLIGLDDQPICWKTAPAGGPFLDEASLPVLSGPAIASRSNRATRAGWKRERTSRSR